jgi:hypothetical protein
MGLFNFGKKKNQSAPQPEKTPSPSSSSSLPSMSDIAQNYLQRSQSSDPSPVFSSTPKRKTWSESVEKFLARSPEAKLFKLTGKPEEFAFYEVGNRCHVEEDENTSGKYNVTFDGSVIGRLPASALKFAESIDSLPEDLSVIIAEVEYDLEKERDIISVYIA